MDKEFMKNVALLLSFIMLAINFFGIHQLKTEVEDLKHDNLRLESNLQMGISNLESRMRENQGEIRKEIKMAQSLFSEVSVDLSLQGDQIAVSVSAQPKEQRTGERLFARIEADGRTYEQELGMDGRTEILIEWTDQIKPVLVLKSNLGERRETLEKVSAQELFAVKVFGEWMEESFCLVIKEGEHPLPFGKEEIEQAEFIIADSGIVRTQPNSGYGQTQASVMEASEEEVAELYRGLKGEKIPALKMPWPEAPGIAYRVELSEFISRKDGVYYDIYFSITTRDGIQYVSENPVASFSFLEGSSSTGSGDEMLRPLFPQRKS